MSALLTRPDERPEPTRAFLPDVPSLLRCHALEFGALFLVLCGLLALPVLPWIGPWWIQNAPPVLDALRYALFGLGVFWTVTTLLTVHYIAACAEFRSWAWLPRLLPRFPRRWASLPAGTAEPIETLFPRGTGRALDFFDPRSKQCRPLQHVATSEFTPGPAAYERLPFAQARLDTLVSFFEAHEIHAPEKRARFLAEAQRVLEPGGTLLILDFKRSALNALLFSPFGYFHFMPVEQWKAQAHTAGFVCREERLITPLVSALVFTRNAEDETRKDDDVFQHEVTETRRTAIQISND